MSEGANMPCVPGAIKVFKAHKILYAPGKASNAGGVAVSGLEMAQNSLRYSWSREEVDSKLQEIMNDIHASCLTHGQEKGWDKPRVVVNPLSAFTPSLFREIFRRPAPNLEK